MKTNTQPSSSEEQKFSYSSPDRESKWNDVKLHSERIRKFASDASNNLEITKDTYYDMYNIAVGLLRCIDGLDPDKRQRDNTTNSSSIISNIANPNFPSVTNFSSGSSSDFASPMHSGSFNADSFFSSSPYISPLQVANFYPPGAVPVTAPMTAGSDGGGLPTVKDTRQRQTNNFSGELYLDGDGHTNTDPKHKRRRRRTFYAPKRNLHCHMCSVTETPEWRRGPNRDHTLCNACGLHYAKSQKKDCKPPKRGKKDPSSEVEKACSMNDIKSDRNSEKEGREEK